MGTRGQLATPSDSTVEGGPGLVLDNVLEVPRNNVHQGVAGRSGLLDSVLEGDIGSQLVHVGLHSEHIGSVVLGDVQEGGECRRSQRTGTLRQSP